MAISANDEFETYEEIPAYSEKLLIRKLVMIWISRNFFNFTLNTFKSFKFIATEIAMMIHVQQWLNSAGTGRNGVLQPVWRSTTWKCRSTT